MIFEVFENSIRCPGGEQPKEVLMAAAKVVGHVYVPVEQTISASDFVVMVNKHNAAPTRAEHDRIIDVFLALPDYIKDRIPEIEVKKGK